MCVDVILLGNALFVEEDNMETRCVFKKIIWRRAVARLYGRGDSKEGGGSR